MLIKSVTVFPVDVPQYMLRQFSSIIFSGKTVQRIKVVRCHLIATYLQLFDSVHLATATVNLCQVFSESPLLFD